jgi:hypothetical protein
MGLRSDLVISELLENGRIIAICRTAFAFGYHAVYNGEDSR